MNRQEIDQTCSSSIGFRIRERSSATYSCRGATAHQAIGSLPSYAIKPGSLLAVTIFFKARLLPVPLPASNSFLGKRQNMHQQPPHAPRSPNNRSKSDQRADVQGWNTKFGSPVVGGMLYLTRKRFTTIHNRTRKRCKKATVRVVCYFASSLSRLACRAEVHRSLWSVVLHRCRWQTMDPRTS